MTDPARPGPPSRGARHEDDADVATPVDVEALTDEILPALIARLRASRLGELEVRSDGWRVRLRRASPATPPSAPLPTGEGRARVASGRATGASVRVPTGEAAGIGEAGSLARSPAVGYFGPGPDLALGRPVQAGDRLGTVDVLGIPQEVTAPTGGVIGAILAEPGQAVEYGQPLAVIDPLGQEGASPLTGSAASEAFEAPGGLVIDIASSAESR
jgi:acetyl-CoA carboxylase biotin carboxyl carrier protein